MGQWHGQVFNCWSACVKLAWGVPRATHTYLVDNLLAGGLPTIRWSVLARFCTFFVSLRSSSSLTLRVMANLSASDIRSVTGSNLFNIVKEILLDPRRDLMSKVKSSILSIRAAVPRQDSWRVFVWRSSFQRSISLLLSTRTLKTLTSWPSPCASPRPSSSWVSQTLLLSCALSDEASTISTLLIYLGFVLYQFKMEI